ncbi:MAG: hypothetical protein Q9225_007819, partial [Loekoesia sp. 1 TL-2023]
MQQLCSKPEYGGHPGHSLHGWCLAPTAGRHSSRPPSGLGRVVFDPLDTMGARSLKKLRVMVGCMYRCFCSDGLDVSTQPWGLQYSASTTLAQIAASHAYEVQIDLVDDFDVPMNRHMGQISAKGGNPSVNALSVKMASQVRYNSRSGPVFGQGVSMSPENNIECRGDRPRFPLPAPYLMSDFANLQQLCAVQWSGGGIGANAGGYCHRSTIVTSSSTVTEERTVWFSDEFTPRHDWTWSGNFYLAAVVRTYCWYRCTCQSSPIHENLTTAVFPSRFFSILARVGIEQLADGSMSLQAPASETSLLQVLPPQTGANPPAGSCGSDGKQFCTKSWPVDLLGAIPQTPPNATQIVATPPWTHKLTQRSMQMTRIPESLVRMPQNEYIERWQKQHGKRLDHEERVRKRLARSSHKASESARSFTGLRAKLYAKKRHAEKIQMKKQIKAHEERNVKSSSAPAEPSSTPLPQYLLDRNQTTNNAKALSSQIKNKRAEKAAKFSVPLPKVKGISEEEMFKVVKTGKKTAKKGWKRMITKPTFVGPSFTRRPVKYERFIRPMGLRYKKAHVTHPELN